MKKSTKALLMTLCAIILICASVMGTLAYLTDTTEKVENTFTAVPGIIDSDTDLFKLDEGKAKLDKGTYSIDTTADRVQGNDYEKVVPGMVIPKDPKMTADVETDVSAYLFVKVVDTTDGNLTWAIDDANWTAVDGVTGVYAYKQVVTGVDGTDLSAINILKDAKVTAAAELDLGTDGDLGDLTFYGYACQAEGFETAAAAWTACFGTNNT